MKVCYLDQLNISIEDDKATISYVRNPFQGKRRVLISLTLFAFFGAFYFLNLGSPSVRMMMLGLGFIILSCCIIVLTFSLLELAHWVACRSFTNVIDRKTLTVDYSCENQRTLSQFSTFNEIISKHDAYLSMRSRQGSYYIVSLAGSGSAPVCLFAAIDRHLSRRAKAKDALLKKIEPLAAFLAVPVRSID